jgi:hypothetical protein
MAPAAPPERGLARGGRRADKAWVRVSAVTVAACAAALVAAGAARADLAVGVADDHGKYAEDGGAFFGTVRELGMAENRITVQWDAARPATIVERGFLDRSLPRAEAAGVRIVLAVYPARATGVTGTPGGAEQFAAFVAQVARTYPQVEDFVIGNEPNQPRFWQPQFAPDGSRVAAAAFYELLWRSYDALKAVDPSIRVIGLGLSERGNDNAAAPSNASSSPVRFLRDLGAAYRASGRAAPIMDALDFHPYPEAAADPLTRAYAWPSVGFGNVDRLKQAIWDAFGGTAQPTVEEGLRLRIGETGWQVAIVPSALGSYTGIESVPVTDEARQAEIYGQLVRAAACDPAIAAVHLFGLHDEPDLDRFQAALVRADGSRRPAFEAVRSAIAETGGRCTGTPAAWRHATTVIGAAASFGRLGPSIWRRTAWSFTVTAAEEAAYRAGIHRLPSNPKRHAAEIRKLQRSAAPAVVTAAGQVRAHWSPRVVFPSRRLARGTYVYRVELAAAMNPARTSTFVSRPFVVR